MKSKLFLIVSAILALTACSRGGDADSLAIIPKPVSVSLKSGKPFTITENTRLIAGGETERSTAAYFAAKVKMSAGYDLQIVDGSERISGDAIYFAIDPALGLETEGYRLTVKTHSISVTGVDSDGLFFGMQTLLQLFPAAIECDTVSAASLCAPCCKVTDYPEFHFRGLHFDPCRHFESVEFIKKQLDVMAMFKFNKMHWHLTEDQGWCIEIKAYPKLTSFGPFYTQDEVREIVAYAAERHIEVYPEFDLPGHCMVAISAYPWLSCTGEPQQPRKIWGIDDVVLCPGKESTFEFLKTVLKEMAALFPCEYFHVGGDECPVTYWKDCPDCQKRIAVEGIKATDKYSAEEMLRTYVLNRVQKILEEQGKTVIGWDELLEGEPAKSAVIMSWRGEEGVIDGAIRGHKVINTAGKKGYYLNYPQGDIKVEPRGKSRLTPLSTTYNYNPLPDTLSTLGLKDYVLGVQGNTWSEYMFSEDMAEYYIYPRALAVAEAGWCRNDAKDYDDFVRRLDTELYKRLDAHRINYHIPLPEQPCGSRDLENFTDSVLVEFTTTRPMKMVYTLDGTEPLADSPQWTASRTFTDNAVINIRSVYTNGRMTPVRTITLNRMDYLPATELDESKLKVGMKVRQAYGLFENRENVEKVHSWNERTIKYLDDLRRLETVPYNYRGIKDYAAYAEGWFKVPADGVYYFSCDLNDVWIDGIHVITNDGVCQQNTHSDLSLPMKAGWHSFRGLFVANTHGGSSNYAVNCNMRWRPAGEPKFKNFASNAWRYQ